MDEAESLRVWASLARHASVVLDVGGHFGIYTVVAGVVNPNATLVAFEPVPDTAAVLQRNLELNRLSGRAVVKQIAALDRTGPAELHVPGGEGSQSSMASFNKAGFRDKAGHVIQIDTTTLDLEAETLGKVSLIKIDVEGFEDRVLRGASRILAEDRPKLIIECLPDGPNAEVESILLEAKYSLFHLSASGPRASERIVPEPTQVYRNYLALPAEESAR
ncbi:MAG: FkbM family methyltransferase [Candidatus Nanopelagicales bacterium]